MALPILEVSRYTCELPVSKKKVEYRPFLVKEQKILLIASESEETTEISTAMVDLINNCVFNREDVNVERLPMMDLEYLFIQIRIKSAGETVKVGLSCKDCEQPTEMEIDLRESKMSGDIPDGNLQLTESIGLSLIYPSISSMPDGASSTDNIFDMIVGCVETVWSGDELFTRDDFTIKELKDFLDQFTTEQFEKINDYFVNMPKYSQIVNWKCIECGVENDRELQGMNDFFE